MREKMVKYEMVNTLPTVFVIVGFFGKTRKIHEIVRPEVV
jgi:hypothetical protein